MLFRLTPAILLAASLPSGVCGAESKLTDGSQFTFQGCYARLTGDQLSLGNTHIQRTWRVSNGLLYPLSLRETDRSREWLASPSSMPSPYPAAGLPDSPARVNLRGGSGVFGPTEAPSLRLELHAAGETYSVDYEFQVFPGATGIRTWVVANRLPKDEGKPSKGWPKTDALEHLFLTVPHIRLTQAIFRDQTDIHNELVFENEWLLHESERDLALQGNLFVLENMLDGSGLIFLKEAPEPEFRPVKTYADLRASGSGLHNGSPRALRVSFYGNGVEGVGNGYPFVLLTYHGGRTGRIAALQNYQRQIRQYDPQRDGKLLSNTWGDRSQEKKLNEAFIRREIDAGAKLGVETVQIDGGWQKGRTAGLAATGGVWNGYWSVDPKFWEPELDKFPLGFGPLAAYAHSRAMELGLWFSPDSSNEFHNRQLDAEQILQYYRKSAVVAFKLDGVKITSKRSEENYKALLNDLLVESGGKIQMDLDVTAETRLGYFGAIAAGPVFVENRYTDWHNYWPHQTLRNLWKLTQYLDPLRLRMEFLNSERNTNLYPDDPLAPGHYRPACLFATVMFASPLAWFENSGLSPAYAEDATALIRTWKLHREKMYQGTIVPIGTAPDGVAWSGFTSFTEGGRDGYVLVFRELNPHAAWSTALGMFPLKHYRCHLLGGAGSAKYADGMFSFEVPDSLGFAWFHVEGSE